MADEDSGESAFEKPRPDTPKGAQYSNRNSPEVMPNVAGAAADFGQSQESDGNKSDIDEEWSKLKKKEKELEKEKKDVEREKKEVKEKEKKLEKEKKDVEEKKKEVEKEKKEVNEKEKKLEKEKKDVEEKEKELETKAKELEDYNTSDDDQLESDGSSAYTLEKIFEFSDVAQIRKHFKKRLLEACYKEELPKRLMEFLNKEDYLRRTPLHRLLARSLNDAGQSPAAEKVVKRARNYLGDPFADAWTELAVKEDVNHLNLLFTMVQAGNLNSLKLLNMFEPKEDEEKKNEFKRRLLRCKHGIDLSHIAAGCGKIKQLSHMLAELKCNVSSFPIDSRLLGKQNEEEKEEEEKEEEEEEEEEKCELAGWSVMHFACREGNSLKYLLERGFQLDELDDDFKSPVDVAVYHEKIDKLRKKYERWFRCSGKGGWWLPAFLTVLDPVERAFPLQRRAEADAEMRRLEYDIRQLQRSVNDANVEILNEKLKVEAAEPYLYLCVERDSHELYRSLLNSSVWRSSVRKTSQDAIEDSTVRMMLAIRQCRKGQKAAEQDGQDGEEEETLKKLVFEKKSSVEGKKRPLLKYLNNGKIFHAYLRQCDAVLAKYSLVGLALLTGRIQIFKCLLLTRQTDVIPTALQGVIQAAKMMEHEKSIGSSLVTGNEYLQSAKDFATQVAINALNGIFAGSTQNQQFIMFQYLLGEFKMPHEFEEVSGDAGLEGFKCVRFDGSKASDSAEPSTKFYVVRDSHNSGPFIGPKFRHHLRADTVFTDDDDRRLCQLCVLQRNVLPLYTVEELANKAQQPDVYATEYFRRLGEMLRRRSFVAPASLKFGKYSIWQKMMQPRWNIVYFLILHAIFLGVFAQFILSDAQFFGWQHIVITVYLVAFVAQDVFELVRSINSMGEGFAAYLKNPWNWYDWVTFVFLLVGLIIIGERKVNLQGYLTDAERTEYIASDLIVYVYNTKVTLAVAFVCSAVKLMHVMRSFETTGPALAIMYNIFINDLFPFGLILIVIIIGFGVFFYTMLTLSGQFFFINETYQSNREQLSLSQIYTRPLLAMFGELDFNDLLRCKEARLSGEYADLCYYEHGVNMYTYFGIILFMIIVNIVMLNMLIAKFSDTVSSGDKHSKVTWIFNRFRMLRDLDKTLPPPLNLVYLPSKWLASRCRPNVVQQEKSSKRKKLQKFLLLQADRMRNCRLHLRRQQNSEQLQQFVPIVDNALSFMADKR